MIFTPSVALPFRPTGTPFLNSTVTYAGLFGAFSIGTDITSIRSRGSAHVVSNSPPSWLMCQKFRSRE